MFVRKPFVSVFNQRMNHIYMKDHKNHTTFELQFSFSVYLQTFTDTECVFC